LQGLYSLDRSLTLYFQRENNQHWINLRVHGRLYEIATIWEADDCSRGYEGSRKKEIGPSFPNLLLYIEERIEVLIHFIISIEKGYYWLRR
jgi:hypothetical protein